MTDTRTAAIYVRISDDKAADAAGVARQERDCRKLANQLGWSVAEVYAENDTSAFKRRKVRLADGTTALRVVRPAFRRLLDDLATGAVDALIGYDLDRVARDPRDLEDLIDIVEQRKVPTRSVTGSLNLSNDAGVTMARVMVAIANQSSRDTSRRVKSKQLELAEAGKVSGGGVRAFGYLRDGLTVDKGEAAIVREIADKLLAGHSLNAVAEWLNAQKVPTVRGGSWGSRSVRSVVCKARVAGLREHKGEIVGPAAWPAILDRDVWERVRITLDDRAHGTTNTLLRWLTGVLICDLCDRPLIGWAGNKGKARYWCATPRGGCGRITVSADRAEEHVEDLLLAYLSRKDVLADLRAETSSANAKAIRREMEADEAQLRELAELWAQKSVTTNEYLTARKAIEARLSASEKVVRASLPGTVRQLLAGDVRQRWHRYDGGQRREVARVVFPDGIRVLPGRAREFDPTRLRPVGWPS